MVYAADIRLSSSCLLADAIIAANSNRAEGGCPAGRGADTIILTRDITLYGGLPKITSDITIEGNGYTISGDNRYRMFYNEGGALTINNLAMTKGYVEGEFILNDDGTFKATTANPFGGAIVNWKGTVTISDSGFSNNSAEWGGAVYNVGELSITSSTFSGNSAERGGAINNIGFGYLSISDSSFIVNSAEQGGAILNGAWLSISDSTFSFNSADVAGGAIANGDYGELIISDSAFSGNSAEGHGAIANKEYGELSITNSSFSDNSADLYFWGGAIYNNEGTLSIINSIIAGRGGNACYSNNSLKQNINNFIQDGSCSPAFRGDPKLGELVAPEDGSPAYFPLLAGSRAIDAADDDYCPAADQIGATRSQGAGCDIGAIEYAAS